MQNNHDQSRGYQFNGSVEAQSIGDSHYYGNESRSEKVKLTVIRESLKIINKKELKLKAMNGKKIQDALISLLCIESFVLLGVFIFFNSAKDITIVICALIIFMGFIPLTRHMQFVHLYSNRPKLLGGVSYVGNYEFMRDEGSHYSIFKVTAKCIYDEGNCPGYIEIVEAPIKEANLGMRIVGKCLDGHGHSYGIDINNLTAKQKPIDWSNEDKKQTP